MVVVVATADDSHIPSSRCDCRYYDLPYIYTSCWLYLVGPMALSYIMIRPGIRFWNLVKKILRHGSGLASKPLLVFVTKEAGDALYNVAVISEIEERRKKEEGGQKAAGMGGPRCS